MTRYFFLYFLDCIAKITSIDNITSFIEQGIKLEKFKEVTVISRRDLGNARKKLLDKIVSLALFN